jgi:hypothetical protein
VCLLVLLLQSLVKEVELDPDTDYMLTTVDNPFNPFTHFKEWHAYDMLLGHYTTAFLARIVRTSDELSEADQRIAIRSAIDEIVRENVSGVHTTVARPKSN